MIIANIIIIIIIANVFWCMMKFKEKAKIIELMSLWPGAKRDKLSEEVRAL